MESWRLATGIYHRLWRLNWVGIWPELLPKRIHDGHLASWTWLLRSFSSLWAQKQEVMATYKSGNPAEDGKRPIHLDEDQALGHAEECNIAILYRIHDSCWICGSISDTGGKLLPSQIRFWNT
jgi:hypothetical protein